VTLQTNFHKKGCWILNKSHLSSDANKQYYGSVLKRSNYSQKNKTGRYERFDAKVSIRIDKHIFGLEEEVTIPCK